MSEWVRGRREGGKRRREKRGEERKEGREDPTGWSRIGHGHLRERGKGEMRWDWNEVKVMHTQLTTKEVLVGPNEMKTYHTHHRSNQTTFSYHNLTQSQCTISHTQNHQFHITKYIPVQGIPIVLGQVWAQVHSTPGQRYMPTTHKHKHTTTSSPPHDSNWPKREILHQMSRNVTITSHLRHTTSSHHHHITSSQLLTWMTELFFSWTMPCHLISDFRPRPYWLDHEDELLL